MKSVYVKTQWIDNKTPVNAANLNKLENALHYLYSNCVGYSELKEGKGISISVNSDKEVEISTSSEVLISENINGIDIKFEGVDPSGCGCSDKGNTNKKGVLYFILDPDTKKLKAISLNGVKIFEV